MSWILLTIIISTVIQLTWQKIVVIDRPTNDSYVDRLAAFGPRILDDSPLEGYLVAVETLSPLEASPVDEDLDVEYLPQSGCRLLQRPDWLDEDKIWIALVERGGCSFVEKARNMQKSGASGLIVGNNEMTSGLITMYASGDTSDVTIPSTFIMQWSYRDLRFLMASALSDASTSNDFLRVRIVRSNEYEWPLLDIIVITIVAPVVILSFLYSLWRFRQRRSGAMDVAHDDQQQPGLLDQEDLSKLEIKSFDPDDMRPLECDNCAICLDEFICGDECRVLKCRHSFHCKCIDLWLTTRSPLCPICKTDTCPPRDYDDEDNEEAPLLNQRQSSLNYPDNNNSNDSMEAASEENEQAADHNTQSPSIYIAIGSGESGSQDNVPVNAASGPTSLSLRISRLFGTSQRSQRTPLSQSEPTA